MKLSGKQASWAAAVLWIAGFLLAFIIKPGTPLIFLPDTLLLLGFFPILFVWKPSWPWLLFGATNIFISFVLWTANYAPDSSLPASVTSVRAHLAQYHVPIVWLRIGTISVVYGLIRMIKNVVSWIYKKTRKG